MSGTRAGGPAVVVTRQQVDADPRAFAVGVVLGPYVAHDQALTVLGAARDRLLERNAAAVRGERDPMPPAAPGAPETLVVWRSSVDGELRAFDVAVDVLGVAYDQALGMLGAAAVEIERRNDVAVQEAAAR